MSTRPDNGESDAPADDVIDRLRRLGPAQSEAFKARLQAGRLRGHDIVAGSLRSLGVTHLYAMPGLPTDETIGACVRAGLDTTGVRHQQAAVMMAAAHNYVAGHVASVAMVSSGVAVTNALTGLVVAQENCWPVLLLAGAVERSARGSGAFMELDGIAVAGPIAKACVRIDSADTIAMQLADAMHTAMEGRPGAVYIEMPADCLSGSAAGKPLVETVRMRDTALSSELSAAIGRAADLLLAAHRPVMLFGKGVRWDDAHLRLRELAEYLSLPFVASPMGRGLLPDDHPLSRTPDQSRLLAEADVVLIVGARLNWTFRYGSEIRPDARIIHIDCADEAFHDGPPRALTIQGPASAILPALLEYLRRRENAGTHRSRAESWPPDAPIARNVQFQPAHPPTPGQLAAALARVLPQDAVVVLDGNVTLLAAQKHISANIPLSRLTPGTSGCMGTGLPFAIGAAHACPERPVIVVTGDMALSLNLFEFETAVRHAVPVVVVLANNDGPSGARRQRSAFPAGHDEHVLEYQAGLRYDEMARPLGVATVCVDTIDALPEALARALAMRRPALIQIQVAPLED
ncbi:MAG: thiamine pyrophosphate-binding protein [Methyloversatilis sp.]|nr:thiamine pyrophosphate-binding protein [Methyloversatilis sp.]MBP6194509.1 thiamine pyrophosphate-binding protein [Methyloversatilis sp.]MBP9118361.1 thiamine pyrophosphate-binding protein [Methyloversatilis sp.]